jgi:uncharacterized membrane protein
MSVQVDKFCDDLRQKLNSIDERITAMKADANGKARQSQQAVKTLLDSVQKRIDARQAAVDGAKAKVTAWAEEKKAKFDGKVSEWKEKGEARRLVARSELAESYAAGMFDLAVAAADEAELALLEASLARLDAQAATGIHRPT